MLRKGKRLSPGFGAGKGRQAGFRPPPGRNFRPGAAAFVAALPALLLAHGAALAGDPFQHVGQLTTQPIGHYEYCRHHRQDCSIQSWSSKPVKLTRERWQQMLSANIASNQAMEPRSDQEIYGIEEYWHLPDQSTFYGDCEDYVLMKRKTLMDQGWPASALLATVVLQPNGEGHAVLTVRTDRGDFVLDNLADEVRRWDKTGYKFLKRVAARHSGRWEDILDSRSIVASIQRSE